MATQAKVVEVEFACPRRWNVLFRPIMSHVRCRIDMSRARTKTEQAVRDQWPQPIPGQRACIDFATGAKWIRDPLHDDEHEQVRALVLRRGWSLPKKRVDYDSESVATWVYHLHKLIKAGTARVVVGELPPVESLEGVPRQSFITARVPDQSEKLLAVLGSIGDAIAANTEMLRALADRIAGKSGAAVGK